MGRSRALAPVGRAASGRRAGLLSRTARWPGVCSAPHTAARLRLVALPGPGVVDALGTRHSLAPAPSRGVLSHLRTQHGSATSALWERVAKSSLRDVGAAPVGRAQTRFPAARDGAARRDTRQERSWRLCRRQRGPGRDGDTQKRGVTGEPSCTVPWPRRHGNGTACSGQSPTWHGGGQLLPAALHVPCPVAGIAAVAGEGGAGDHEGACPPSLHQGPGRSRGTERAVRSGVTPGSGPGGAAGESAGRGRRRGHRQGLLGGHLCPSHRATLEDTPCLREEGVPHSWGPPACAAQAPRPVTPSPSSEVLGTA